MHRSMIDGMTVASDCLYIVYGSVRGLVSEHRKLGAAIRSMQKDASDCHSLGGGAYSDAAVYAWSESDGWITVDTYAPEGR